MGSLLCRNKKVEIVKKNQKVKVLIIHPEGNIKNNPNLYYFTKELVGNGFEVIVYSAYRPEIYQGDLFPGASCIYYTSSHKKEIVTLLFLLKQNISFILGVDEGIIKAKKYANILNTNYGFLSYEIFFDHELAQLKNTYFSDLKEKSRAACKDIKFAIVQDDVRKELLIREYDISCQKIFLMPVAGSGCKALEKTFYFHTKLNIPREKRVLLYMGWMNEELLNRLFEYVSYLPKEWVLVIHSRYKYSKGIIPNMNIANVYFSFDEPIENIEDINILLNGCDVGFCSYKPNNSSPYTGDNIKYIGLASGKTSTFLQHGIPVVVENMDMWEEIIFQTQIGLVLKSKDNLRNLDVLLEKRISENCYSFFENYLDIKNYLEPIIIEIKSCRVTFCSISKLMLFILKHTYAIIRKALLKKKNNVDL